MMPGTALIGALGIGTVMGLLRAAAKANEHEAAVTIARVMRAESERNTTLALQHAQRAANQKELAQAQLQIALQRRGLVQQSGPTAAYITALRSQGGV